jgi:hypothetical protein
MTPEALPAPSASAAKSTPSQDSQQKPASTPQKSSTHPHKTPTAVLPSAANVIAPIIPTPAPTATVLGDVVSRDDLLSHLLAMGFAESDCLAAISSCGLNVDMAISWLCDPPPPSQTKAGDSKEQKKATGTSVSAPSPQELDAQLKLQKDKEHKEEQRRINRAWNARVPQQRAEEERKKVSPFPSSPSCFRALLLILVRLMQRESNKSLRDNGFISNINNNCINSNNTSNTTLTLLLLRGCCNKALATPITRAMFLLARG